MADRTPRTRDTREASERKKPWKRASMLPVPDPRAGISFRWVRTSTLGKADNTNVSQRFREGFVPVKASDFPELHIMSDIDSRFKANIEVGGLLLCSIPSEDIKDRIEGQLEAARLQDSAADRNYMREQDPRMPMQSENRSKTSFGSG